MDLNAKLERPFYWLNILTGVFCLVFLYLNLYLYVWKKKTRTKSKNVLGLEDIPGPKPTLPIKSIGNIPQLWPTSNALPVFVKCGETYPEMFKITGLNTTFVVLVSPELIQQLFKSSDLGHGVKSPAIYNLGKPYHINGLGVSKGKFWQSQRRILNRTQALSNLKAYMGMLNKNSKEFVNEMTDLFADAKTHTINAQLNVLFLKWICEMITGSNINSVSELDRYHHNFDTWKKAALKRVLAPWLLIDFVWKLHPISKAYYKAVYEMIDFAKAKIKQNKINHAVAEANGSNPESDTASFRTMLNEMLSAGMSDDQIVDEMNTLIMGGYETGSTALHFFCLMMGLYPQVQKSCQTEIDAVFENMEHNELSYETATSGLKYVERCLQETLRLFPPSFMFFRELETPLNIESKNKRYELPVGCNVIVSPFTTHRNSNYFPCPEKFDPDRFLPEEVAKRHYCSFIPFSGGPRGCFGQKFAMIQMKVIAAYILRNFEIKSYTKLEDVALLPYISLSPDRDFVFELKRRDICSDMS